MAQAVMIDTGKVTDRRKLRFASLDELSRDVDRIVAAERAGRLRTTGNWSAGTNLGHVAAWMTYPYEGFPPLRPPWFVRMMMRLFLKKKLLRDGLPAGFRMPKVAEGTFGIEALSVDEGAARLRKAIARFKSGEPTKFASPAFGPMPLEGVIQGNLRHAELHLSFLHPEG